MASWTSVDSDSFESVGSDTTIASPGVTIAAGNAAIVFVGCDDSSTTISVSDGTSSLTGLTTNPDPLSAFQGRFFYILSSVASGTNSVVYTATFGTSVAARSVIVWTFSYSGTASLLTEDHSGGGFGDTATSGGINISGSDVLVIGASRWGSGKTPSSQQLNGLAATADQATAGGDMWYRVFTTSFTGGTASTVIGTLGVDNQWWVCSAVALSATASSGPDTYPAQRVKFTRGKRPNKLRRAA